MDVQTRMTAAAEALREQEEAFERAFSQSRAIIRKTKTAIHGIHMDQRDMELTDSISSDLARMTEDAYGFPSILCGPHAEEARSEFAETMTYDRTLRREGILSHMDLDVTPGSWVEGLADSIGDLRRDMLTALMENNVQKAASVFSSMEVLSDALMDLDVKDSIAPVKRKQDIARRIDRSRQNIATAGTVSRIRRVLSIQIKNGSLGSLKCFNA